MSFVQENSYSNEFTVENASMLKSITSTITGNC